MAKNTFVAEVSFNIKPITYRNLSAIAMIDILVTIAQLLALDATSLVVKLAASPII